MNNKILFVWLSLISTTLFAKSVSLEDLYSRYEKADYSSMELPEYQKTINFEAVVVNLDKNIQGDTLIEVASPDDAEVAMARVTPASSEENKFTQLKVGQKVNLECYVEMTMGSEYLGLGECKIK